MKHMAYVTHGQFGRHYCSGTCMTVTCDVDVTVSCVLAIYAPKSDLYACRMRAGCPIFPIWYLYCLVIYASNTEFSVQNMCAVLLVTFFILVTSYVAHICIYIPVYAPERYDIYGLCVQSGGHNLWCIYFSLLCIGKYMPQWWICMPI